MGSLNQLPPTLARQFHFMGMGWRPCAGAGINFTHFSSVESVPAVQSALKPLIDRNSVGLAVQAGVGVPLGDGWLLNLDIKKAQIRTDVFSFGAQAGTFKVDPPLVGAGIATLLNGPAGRRRDGMLAPSGSSINRARDSAAPLR